jgi:hypothetical protein
VSSADAAWVALLFELRLGKKHFSEITAQIKPSNQSGKRKIRNIAH